MIGRRPERISSDRFSSLTHPICVIGMGRSGTSLTTALIGLLGIYLGPEERMLETVEHDNARGYWEQREVYEINEEIFSAFGGSWEKPPSLPLDWEHSPALEDARGRARTLLADMFGGSNRRWGWKDPRTAITLPLWRELIGEMDYVLCVRNPADVAGSLAARKSHDLDFGGSVALWYHYIRATLDNTQGSRRLILNYEDYFLDPDRQIERLTEFLWGPEAHPSDEVRERLERFVEPGLWHNRDPGNGIDRVRAVSHEAADLYERLSASGAASNAAQGRVRQDRSLFVGVQAAQIWWLASIFSLIVAVTDALIGNSVILIPLLAAGSLCALLTGRWIRTATVGIWTIVLAVLLCFPDGIWGTSAQLVYLSIVVIAALLSTSAASLIERYQ